MQRFNRTVHAPAQLSYAWHGLIQAALQADADVPRIHSAKHQQSGWCALGGLWDHRPDG